MFNIHNKRGGGGWWPGGTCRASQNWQLARLMGPILSLSGGGGSLVSSLLFF